MGRIGGVFKLSVTPYNFRNRNTRRMFRRPGSVSNFKFKTVIIVIIVSEALPCFDLGVTWERKVRSPESK